MSYRNLLTNNKKEWIDLSVDSINLSDGGAITAETITTNTINELTALNRVQMPDGLKVNNIENIAGDLNINTLVSGDIKIVAFGDLMLEDLKVNGTGLKTDEIAELTPSNSVAFLDGLKTNTIVERQGNMGVLIETLLLKDGSIDVPANVLTDNILELTPNSGCLIENTLLKDGNVTVAGDLLTDVILENSPGVGCRIELNLLQDGNIDCPGVVFTDDISEKTPLVGVRFSTGLKTNDIEERLADSGVTIDNLLIKDQGINNFLTTGGIPSILNFYQEETSLSLTFDSAASVLLNPEVVPVSLSRIGNQVTLSTDVITGLSKLAAVGASFDSNAIPSQFRPRFQVDNIAAAGIVGGIIDTGSPYRCVLLVNGVLRIIFKYGGNFFVYYVGGGNWLSI